MSALILFLSFHYVMGMGMYDTVAHVVLLSEPVTEWSKRFLFQTRPRFDRCFESVMSR